MMRHFSCLLMLSVLPLFGHGTHDERVEHYSTKVEREPHNRSARLNLTQAFLEAAEWEHALEQLDFADALPATASCASTRPLRARALAMAGKNEEARAVLDPYLSTHPDDAEARFERARILNALHLSKEAAADYLKAIESMPHPEAKLWLEAASALGRLESRAEAVALLDRAIQTHGKETSLVLKAMELHCECGAWDTALTHAATLQALMPRPEPMMAKKALILTQAGRQTEARAAWEALLKHIEALPNLERGAASLVEITNQARNALAHMSPK